jgi:hypothetical protein
MLLIFSRVSILLFMEGILRFTTVFSNSSNSKVGFYTNAITYLGQRARFENGLYDADAIPSDFTVRRGWGLTTMNTYFDL